MQQKMHANCVADMAPCQCPDCMTSSGHSRGLHLRDEDHVMWQQLGRYLFKQVDVVQAGLQMSRRSTSLRKITQHPALQQTVTSLTPAYNSRSTATAPNA
jgi:hypothetical protein